MAFYYDAEFFYFFFLVLVLKCANMYNASEDFLLEMSPRSGKRVTTCDSDSKEYSRNKNLAMKMWLGP